MAPSSPIHRRAWFFLSGLALATIIALQLPIVSALDFELMRATVLRNGGNAVSFNDWQKLLSDAQKLGNTDKLKRVNEFFNRRIRFGEDWQIWGQSDYWATPMETLSKGKGDCEDFVIAKYFTLLLARIPNEQLRLVYVKASIGGPNSKIVQAHMVLAYYATPDADPLLLDNLITDIRPASRRPDLMPIFSFSSQGVWAAAAGGTTQGAGGVGQLSRWQDLLRRARAEGFD